MALTKSYIYNKHTKQILDDYHKPFMYEMAGGEQRFNLQLAIENAVKNEPATSQVLDEYGVFVYEQKASEFYSQVVKYQILNTLFIACETTQEAILAVSANLKTR